MKVLIIFIFWQLSSVLFAQSYPFELRGTYILNSSPKKTVQYDLRWSQVNGKINGTYRDDVLAERARVTGEGNENGQTFIIQLPKEKNDVQSLLLMTASLVDKESSLVQIHFIPRDNIGRPLPTISSNSKYRILGTEIFAQKQEDTCSQGFGVLLDYCGRYAGKFLEDSDRRNKCNLIYSDVVNLELSDDATLRLHLADARNNSKSPMHILGRIPYEPETRAIDILSRACGPLVGVNSDANSCKRLHLSGTFSSNNDDKHFEGTYTITEEGTNNSCRYRLSMSRK